MLNAVCAVYEAKCRRAIMLNGSVDDDKYKSAINSGSSVGLYLPDSLRYVDIG